MHQHLHLCISMLQTQVLCLVVRGYRNGYGTGRSLNVEIGAGCSAPSQNEFQHWLCMKPLRPERTADCSYEQSSRGTLILGLGSLNQS